MKVWGILKECGICSRICSVLQSAFMQSDLGLSWERCRLSSVSGELLHLFGWELTNAYNGWWDLIHFKKYSECFCSYYFFVFCYFLFVCFGHIWENENRNKDTVLRRMLKTTERRKPPSKKRMSYTGDGMNQKSNLSWKNALSISHI